MKRERLGRWNKNPDIIKNWSKADFLINNNELHYSINKEVSLGKLTGRRAVSIRAFLYALFYLQEENPDYKTFRFHQIYEMVVRKHIIIKLLISRKGKLQIIPQAWKFKHERGNYGFNVEEKIESTIDQFQDDLRKIKITKEHLYIAMGWLSGVFIDIVKDKTSDEENAYSGAFPKVRGSGNTEFIQLNKDGKELMSKHKDEGFLL